MQYGDVYSHFLDLCEEDLGQLVDHISLEKIQSSFELCLRKGISAEDKYCTMRNCPYKVSFSSCSFSEQLMKIANLTSNISQEDMDKAFSTMHPSSLTGLLAMTIDCSNSYPLSIVLSYKSMTKYAMLFRHLFNNLILLRQLSKALTCQDLSNLRILEQRMDLFRGSMGRLRGLKNKMTFTLKVIQGYLFHEVLEYHWKSFITQLYKVSLFNLKETSANDISHYWQRE